MGVLIMPTGKIASEAEILAAISAVYEKLGRRPIMAEYDRLRAPDAPMATTCAKRFGGWNEALKAAGINTAYTRKLHYLTDMQLIQDFKAIVTEYGSVPDSHRYEMFRHPGMAGATTYIRRFGSWHRLVLRAGYSPKDIAYSEESMIRDVRAITKKLGRVPTLEEYDLARGEDMPSSTCIKNHFGGSWINFLEKAGLDTGNRGVRFSDEELIASLRKVAEKLGYTPSSREYDDNFEEGMPTSCATFMAHFGGWNEALKAAGLKPKDAHWFTVEEMLNAVRALAERLGTWPTSYAYSQQKRPGDPTVAIFYRRFGTWRKVLELAKK
jgi:hypothetical protein